MSRDPQFCYPTLLDAISPHDFFPTPLHALSRPMIRALLPRTRPMDDVPLSDDAPQEEDLALAAMAAPSFMNCLYFPRNLERSFERNVLFDPGSQEAARWETALTYYLAKLSALHPSRRLLLKNPSHSVRIASLRRMFPQAKFVHIHRHPGEVTASMQKLYRTLVPLLALQAFDLDKVDAHVLATYPHVMQRLREGLRGLPAEDIVTVRYDDLVENPLATIQDIYTSLGIGGFLDAKPRMAELIDDSKGRKRPPSGGAPALRGELQSIADWLGYR